MLFDHVRGRQAIERRVCSRVPNGKPVMRVSGEVGPCASEILTIHCHSGAAKSTSL